MFLFFSQPRSPHSVAVKTQRWQLQWIKADVGSRNQYLIDLATLLDFRKVTPGFGKYLAHEEELCYRSSEFMKLLYLASINDSSVIQKSPQISFQNSAKNSLVIFDKTSMVLKSYKPESKSWEQLQELHDDMKHGHYASVIVDNFVFVFLQSKKSYRLNIMTTGSIWERVPDMLCVDSLPHAAVQGDKIYVVGSHAMEKYRISERKWERVNIGIANCKNCTLVVHDSSLYTIGGTDRNGQTSAEFIRYSPFMSSWTALTPLLNARALPGAAVHNDNIFVAGGSSIGLLNDFMKFDLRVGTWTLLSPMTVRRHYFGLHVVANKLYAVGDYNRSSSIETYDFERAKWTIEKENDRDMKFFATATVTAKLP